MLLFSPFLFLNTNSLRIFAISFSYLIYHFYTEFHDCRKKIRKHLFAISPRFSVVFLGRYNFLFTLSLFEPVSPCVCGVCWQVGFFFCAMKLHIPHLCFPISYISYTYLIAAASAASAAVVVFGALRFVNSCTQLYICPCHNSQHM